MHRRGIVLPLLAEWKLERCALKFFVMNFRVEDSLIFMCAAHGKKYGSFPLKKLHLYGVEKPADAGIGLMDA